MLSGLKSRAWRNLTKPIFASRWGRTATRDGVGQFSAPQANSPVRTGEHAVAISRMLQAFSRLILVAFVVAVVNASAQVTVTPTSVDFGSVGLGTQATNSLDLTNSGTATVEVTSYVFLVTTSGCPSSIFGLIDGEFPRYITAEVNGIPTVSRSSIGVRLAPGTPLPATCAGTLTINFQNGSPSPITVLLTVEPVNNSDMIPVLSASAGGPAITSINFGNVPLGMTQSQPLIVTNTGTAAFEVTYVDYYQPFNVTLPTSVTLPYTLIPGSSLSLTVSYTSCNLGSNTGFVTISYNDVPSGGIDLTGTGTTPSGLAITNYPILPAATQSGTTYAGAYQLNPLLAGGTPPGGTPPYNWQITGSLPTGLTLDTSSGTISGNVSATAEAQNYPFTVTVTDSSTPPQQASASLTLPVGAATGANCSVISVNTTGTSTPNIALNDLLTGTYLTCGNPLAPCEGGLYPNGSDTDDPTHHANGVTIAQNIIPLDTSGNPDPTNGVIGLVSLGQSTTEDSFNTLLYEGGADPAKNSKVVLVNGALGNETAQELVAHDSAYLASILTYLIPFAGITPAQVEVAWVNAQDSLTQSFPTDAQTLQGELESLAQLLQTSQVFPNLKIIYFGSLNYTGYSYEVDSVNPEPQGYESAFADKWTIQDQIDGTCSISGQTGACLNYTSTLGTVKAPWIEWGPYYWANGLLARQDGTFWSCQDMGPDGLHPTYPGGHNKINSALLNLLKTDPTATPWFLASSGPAVALQPPSLTFGPQAVGTTSAAQQITVTNTGLSDLTISSVTIIGTDSSDFGLPTQTCTSASVLPNGTCTINVTFTPTANGTRTASVSITDNATGSPQTVGLTGSGGLPAVMLSPTSLTFAEQVVATTSAAQTVTLTNTGTGPLTVTTVASTGPEAGDYTPTTTPANNCGTTVAAGASCTISVTFKPHNSGPSTGTITITDSAAGSPQTVALSGVGTFIQLLPASLTFASQTVATTSAAQTVTLTNTLTGQAIPITSVSFTGTDASDFAETNTCAGSVSGGGSCTISVTFTPIAAGTRTATLTVADTGGGGTQTVAVTGTATGSSGTPMVTLSLTSLTFAEQVVATTSAAQTVTLSNPGTGVLAITSMTVTGTDGGDFTPTSTCGTFVAAGANCTISVTFKPHGDNARAGTLSITDNATTSPQSVSLSGVGTYVELVPASLTFASQTVGTTSAAQTVTLTNTLPSATLTFTSPTVITGANAGDFAQTNTCGSSVAPAASCTISVTFKPTAAGTRTAAISITDGGGGSPQTVTLMGTASGSAVTLAPTSLTFASQPVGTTSASQSVTLTNAGTSALSITSVSITGTNPGDYAQTNTCGTSVAAGASCSLSVTFTPAASGTRTASVSIADNAAGSPQLVTLTGTGTGSGTPAVTLSPTTGLTFAGQTVGTTTAAQTVTLTNTGNVALSITSISVTGTDAGDFKETNTCGTSVTAGASCAINVTFTPAALGIRTALVNIADNASNSPQTVALTGTTGPVASLSPSTGLTFAATNVGSASAAQTLTLTNTGSSTLTLTSIALAGVNSGDFTYTSTCGSNTVQPNASCTLMVTFKPMATGSRTATITITDNAPGSPQTVSLNGTGITTPGASLSSASLTFSSSQAVGTASPLQNVTLTSTGSATLTISSISITGTGSSSFSDTNSCAGKTLAAAGQPNNSCTISVYFKPEATGELNASVTVADNAPDTPQAVTLTGSGVASGVGFQPPSLVFTGESLNTRSAPQDVTLTNTGTAALSISSIAFTGSDAADFAQTNNCPTSGAMLAAGGTCMISVTFSPTAGGNLSASLTVSDNAPGSPHSMAVSGAGSSFAVTTPTSTESVPAGQAATYGLSFAPTGGFSGSVTLSCTTTAPAASCSVAPATLTLNAPNVKTATATVTTTANGAIPPNGHLPSGPGPWLWYLSTAVVAMGFGLLRTARQRTRWALTASLLLLLAWAGCGGGGSTTPSGPASTPAGTYQVTVTASSTGVSQNVTLTLTVQ